MVLIRDKYSAGGRITLLIKGIIEDKRRFI